MNIHELNSIAANIRSVDFNTRKINLDSVVDYCIKKHNEMVTIMHEVYDFVEQNFDLFDSDKIAWNGKSRNKLYYANYNIGNANPYNCVIRDFHHEGYCGKDNTRIYWVDDGIIFRIRMADKKICRLCNCDNLEGHGYKGDMEMWNDSYDFTQFHYPISEDYGANIPDWDKLMWKKDHDYRVTEFNAEKFKKDVDEDLEHAQKVVERLGITLKKINESVMSRQSKVDKVLDESKKDGIKTINIKIEIS